MLYYRILKMVGGIEITGEVVGNVLGIKILTPKISAGFEITIIDDRQVFRNAKLNQQGSKVQLTPHAGLPPIADRDELFVSAFHEIGTLIP